MKNYLVYIGFAFPHHKYTHAGYHHIKDYIQYDKVIDLQGVMEKESIYVQSFGGKLKIKFNILLYLLKCSWLALSKGHVVFHFIYGENNFVNCPLLHLRNSKIVVTFHQPYSWFENNKKWQKRLMTIDEIILVGKAEINQFQMRTGKHNVRFFPHGICTDFYCPDNNVPKEDMVLMVGNWLRDFQFASCIFSRLKEVSPKTRIVVVTNRDNAHFFSANDNVDVLSGISDENLRSLYRKTSCLFLPLERYTANNALLEAAAVGCNILIASNHADNSYIPEEYINICPLDESVTINTLLKIMKHDTNTKLSDFIKKNYSWEIVGKQIKCFLDTIN